MALIAIIDDDPDIIEASSLVLKSKGHDLITASNPDDGFKIVTENNPQLIILDVMMDTPQDGFILSRQLKQDTNYKDIPILMLTSVKDVIGIDFESVAGDDTWLPVDKYLPKPVKPEVLLEKVAELLEK